MRHIVKQLAEQRTTPLIGQTFPLTEAAKAHEAIEARRTVAKTLLLTE
jgi:NADPH:quinone reductase